MLGEVVLLPGLGLADLLGGGRELPVQPGAGDAGTAESSCALDEGERPALGVEEVGAGDVAQPRLLLVRLGLGSVTVPVVHADPLTAPPSGESRATCGDRTHGPGTTSRGAQLGGVLSRGAREAACPMGARRPSRSRRRR